jgi:hypothetical protein
MELNPMTHPATPDVLEGLTQIARLYSEAEGTALGIQNPHVGPDYIERFITARTALVTDGFCGILGPEHREAISQMKSPSEVKSARIKDDGLNRAMFAVDAYVATVDRELESIFEDLVRLAFKAQVVYGRE